jgi:hypothetical protein
LLIIFAALGIVLNKIVIDKIFNNGDHIVRYIILIIINVMLLSMVNFVGSITNHKMLKKHEKNIFQSDFENLNNLFFIKKNAKIQMILNESINLVYSIINTIIVMAMFIYAFRSEIIFIYALLIYLAIATMYYVLSYKTKQSDVVRLIKSQEKFVATKTNDIKSHKEIRKKVLEEKHKSEEKLLIKNSLYSSSFTILKKVTIYFIMIIVIYMVLWGSAGINNLYYIYFCVPYIYSTIDNFMATISSYKLLSPLVPETNYYFNQFSIEKNEIKSIETIKLENVDLLDKNSFDNKINMELKTLNIFKLKNVEQEQYLIDIFKLQENFYEGKLLINNLEINKIDTEYFNTLIMRVEPYIKTKHKTLIEYLSNGKFNDEMKLNNISSALLSLNIDQNILIHELEKEYYFYIFQIIYMIINDDEKQLIFIDSKKLNKIEKESLFGFIMNSFKNKYFIIFD